MSDQEIVREPKEVLVEHLSLAKVARLRAMCQLGRGNYQTIREDLFADETVETLYKKIETYQHEGPQPTAESYGQT